MGSRPWKASTLRRWERQFSGQRVRVVNPGRIYNDDETITAETVEGLFVGHGSWRGVPCIYVHTRPEMNVREAGYFDHEWAILLQSEQMAVEALAL